MRWEGHAAHVEKRNMYRIFVGKLEGKRLLGKLKRKWEENINIVREIGWSGVDRSDLIWLRIGTSGGLL
jgi:hypothetical protein